MCQRPNPTTVKITKSAREFHELLAQNSIEIIDVTHLNEHLDRVVFRHKAEFVDPPKTNSVIIAACVTAHGRRLLYSTIMEAVRLKNSLLYCDTDSLIVKRNKGQETITEGKNNEFDKKFLSFIPHKIRYFPWSDEPRIAK